MPYIYQADVWCDECGERIKADIARKHPELVPVDPTDEYTFDSDRYPKQYNAENTESDGPENCGNGWCDGDRGAFLRNQLTSEGYRYLKEMLDAHGPDLPPAAKEWAEYYGFRWREKCANCNLDMDECECNPKLCKGSGEWVSPEMY